MSKDAWGLSDDDDFDDFNAVDVGTATTQAPLSSPTATAAVAGAKGKPHLKIGIVLPKRIFKRRQYREVISRTLNQVLQSEYCLVTTGMAREKRSRRAGLSFQNRPMPPQESHNTVRQSSRRIRNHITTLFNFTWSPSKFRLEDELDAINYGELVVSPPPSGQSCVFTLPYHFR